MADKEERDDQEKGRSAPASRGGDDSSGEGQTGDPGRTPGTAEGDEQTVEEDLRQKEEQGRI
ncbi:MAG TPA: hypothetical protein VE842_00930 [Pyrinomonadaceae bacterium]|jgi:hypothetical protein|nr:hypothetical protein [Pyrinomonadaceae bacterium]